MPITIGLMLLGCVSCSGPDSQLDPTAASSRHDLSGQEPDILARLLDEQSGAEQQRAAAWLLLEIGSDETVSALAQALDEQSSPAVWSAVARAITLYPDDPPPSLAQPLYDRMVGSRNDQVEADLAEALGRVTDRQILEELIKLARDSTASIDRRRRTILALSHHCTQRIAGALIELTDPGEPPDIQAATFEGLRHLTGMESFGNDRVAWLRWWDQARRWSPYGWRQWLIENLARSDAAWRARYRQMEARLVESQQALYRSSSPEDRPQVLSSMLSDPQESLRSMAMNLALQRLLDDLSFDTELRLALRGRLLDESPRIRQIAAWLLRDLADESAADLVAERLVSGDETVNVVLRANLLMMARLPRAEAVGPALSLLKIESLRGEAAGVLAASADAGLLEARQADRALQTVREQLSSNQPPSPKIISLLGKIGDPNDWRRIAGWVDSPDDAVKKAAAQAWADSDRSLKFLTDRMEDPVVQPIVFGAARRRRADPETLEAILRHRPDQEQAVESWRRAIIAMAGRVPPAAVSNAVRQLEAHDEPPTLISKLLTAGIDGPSAASGPTSERLELILKRADTRLATGAAAAALSDYQRILAKALYLTAEQLEMTHRGRIRAYLLADELEKAFDVARTLLGPPDDGGVLPPTDDPVIDRFIAVARRYTTNNQLEEARALLVKLRLLLGPLIETRVAERIKDIEAAVEQDTGPAVTPGHTEPDDLDTNTNSNDREK